MDWFKQNKFLSGWLIVTLLGAAVLGYLCFSAKSQYSEVVDTYSGKVGELQGLQNQTPYPDEENFKKMQELQKVHQAAIDDLHQQLVKTEIPVTPLTAVRFQDELRESVRRVSALATERGTKLPDKFYLAFDRYQAEPPKDEAAAPLGRMLKAVEHATNLLIESGAEAITDIKRDPLPEEGGDKSAAATPPKPQGAKSGKDEDESALVRRHPIEINFIATEPRFRRFINELIGSKTQFYIPRGLVIANEKTSGPSKTQPGIPQVPVPNPNVPGESAKKGVNFIVGNEKLTVATKIDVADFADVAKPTK